MPGPRYSLAEITENRRNLVAALRSRAYKQGTGSLYDQNTDTYCCLGVAAEISSEALGIIKATYELANGKTNLGYLICDGSILKSSLTPEILAFYGFSPAQQGLLISINDCTYTGTSSHSFNFIATLIEEMKIHYYDRDYMEMGVMTVTINCD